jgi:hypothetical protein
MLRVIDIDNLTANEIECRVMAMGHDLPVSVALLHALAKRLCAVTEELAGIHEEYKTEIASLEAELNMKEEVD